MGRFNWRTDHPVSGILLGLVAPLLGAVVFYFVQSIEMHGLAWATYMKMLENSTILSMVLSWSLLANLVVFAIFNRLDFWRSAQGVVIATLLYGMLIIYLKMF